MKGLFVEVLLMAHFMGYVKLGNISIDGSKIHADASKSKAVSYSHIDQVEHVSKAGFTDAALQQMKAAGIYGSDLTQFNDLASLFGLLPLAL